MFNFYEKTHIILPKLFLIWYLILGIKHLIKKMTKMFKRKVCLHKEFISKGLCNVGIIG